MAFQQLPTEVLQEIISYFPTNPSDRKDLLNCSRVCQSLWEAATALIYRDIDLKTTEYPGDEINEKNVRRQARLLKSIAENLKLGALVKSFYDHEEPYGMYREPAYVTPDIDLMLDAAKNMTRLSAASLATEHLSDWIIMNLPSFDSLSNLKVDGFVPSKLIWRNLPTSLKSLQWSIGDLNRDQVLAVDAVVEASFLLKVVEETCPHLESFDISFTRESKNFPTKISPEIIKEYSTLPPTTYAKLTRLRHFGFNHIPYREEQQESLARAFVLDIVRRYSQTLTSIAIPGSSFAWTRSQLDFVLEVCAEIPSLLELKLSPDPGDHGTKLTPSVALRELITSPATAKMEKFSTRCIEGPFSAELGQLFSPWKNLRFLHVGDEDIAGGPYGDDGRPQFDLYRPHILAFVQNLPDSLRELYLEINGEGVTCDEDEDFDYLAYGFDTGTDIFNALTRLHTCDIHAWISNVDGGLGMILPEKGVFFRRLGNPAATSPKEKIIWTSRMDQLYQEENILVKKNSARVTNEAFEGEDAKEVWLDGLAFGPEFTRRVGTQRGKQNWRPDQSWPFCKDVVQNRIKGYEMWRTRH
ncbi:hypothetical protein VTL71DRAFT_13101 [Oculimacula yallundae]|uniref:F-box domain-containing protein n=1 Tax=Oculimacula yallundae TaxID=86028 RepID=A0ABR4CRN6_9HELO